MDKHGNTQIFSNDMNNKNAHTDFKAGDEVKLPRKTSKKNPDSQIDSTVPVNFFPVNFEGVPGQIFYNKVYQVSGKTDLVLVDNSAKPLPLIAKDFINNPVYNAFFKKLNSTTENEDA